MLLTIILSLISVLIATTLWSIKHFKSKKLIDKRNKAILITGCDSGLGLAMAQYLCELDLIIFAACLSDKSHGFSILTSYQGKSNSMIPVIMDVTNQKSVENCLQKVQENLKKRNINGLWSLVNNAGVLFYGEMDWLTIDQCEKTVNVNLLGPVRVCKAFLPEIIRAKGRIVNIGSNNGLIPYPGTSIYSASKSGLRMISKTLRYEMSKFGVQVIHIDLGDFSKCTNIMANHKQIKQQMWNEMNDEKRKLYGKYFEVIHELSIKNAGLFANSKLEDTMFYPVIREAILQKHARNEIACKNYIQTIFDFILSLCSENIRTYFFVQSFRLSGIDHSNFPAYS